MFKNKKFIIVFSIMAGFFLAAGCVNKGSGGGPNDTPPNVISAVVSKGLINGGNVEIFELLADGSKGPLLKTATTAADGTFSVGVGNYTGPVLVEVRGGTYTDEATGTVVTNYLMRAAMPSVSRRVTMAVTPLTEVATILAELAGGLTVANITTANALVSGVFNGIDIINTQPIDVLSPPNANDTQAQIDYGLMLAAVSQLINNDPALNSVYEAIVELAADLGDGNLNTMEAAFTAALTDFIASANNQSGVATPALIVINNSVSDTLAVQIDTAALAIGYTAPDTATSVTSNVTLPTWGANGTTISWVSSDPALIATDGTITRAPFGGGNQAVTLTATISKNGIFGAKTFDLTVLETLLSEAAAVVAAKTALEVTYGGTDSAANVTQNVTLDTVGQYVTTITWASSAPAIIAIDGTVVRPAFGSGDQPVTLTATISKNGVKETKVFNLTVIESPLSDADAVAADKAALDIAYGGTDWAGGVTQNIGLNTSGSNSTTITWASTLPSIIALDGTVTRPAYGGGDQVVTLVATITKGGATAAKVFDLTVTQTPPSDTEAVAADKTALAIIYGPSDSAGSVTQNVGLSTGGSNSTTITWASDTPGVIAIDGRVTRSPFGSGNQTVTLTATIRKGLIADTKQFVLTVIEAPISDIDAVTADTVALAITYGGTDSAGSVTQNVGLPFAGSNGTSITWASDTTGTIAADGIVTRPPFGGGNHTVILTATIRKNLAAANKQFTLTVIEAPLSDAAAVTADNAALSIIYGGSDSAGSVTQNLGLPVAGPNGSTITWSASDPTIIDANGAVNRPAVGAANASAVLAATIKKGGVSETKIFLLTVIAQPAPLCIIETGIIDSCVLQ